MNGTMLRMYHSLPAPLRCVAADWGRLQIRGWRYGSETDQLVEEALELLSSVSRRARYAAEPQKITFSVSFAPAEDNRSDRRVNLTRLRTQESCGFCAGGSYYTEILRRGRWAYDGEHTNALNVGPVGAGAVGNPMGVATARLVMVREIKPPL